jgi:hypothetical protein
MKLRPIYFIIQYRMRMLEDWVLRIILGPQTDEVTEEWRKLHKAEHDTYFPPDILRVSKSRRIGWGERVARVGRGKVHAVFCWGNQRERDHLENVDIVGRILLKHIFRKSIGIS